MARGNGFAHRLYTGDLSFDFVGRRKTSYIATALDLALRPLLPNQARHTPHIALQARVAFQ